jgi:hypothetical protein
MISNTNYEAHKDEVELLKNILFDQLSIIDEMPHFTIDIAINLDSIEEPKLDLAIKVKLPEEYPNAAPIYELAENNNILPTSKLKALSEKIKDLIQENLSYPMIYQIYELVKDFAIEQEELLNIENISKLTLEEDSKKKFQDKILSIENNLIETKTFTPVSKESFEIWFKKFYAEKNKKSKIKVEMEQRQTGREYFMNVKNLKTELDNESEDEEDTKEITSESTDNAIFYDAEAFGENIDDIDFDEDIDIDGI